MKERRNAFAECPSAQQWIFLMIFKNIASLELINEPKRFPIRAKHLARGMSGNEHHHALDADRGETLLSWGQYSNCYTRRKSRFPWVPFCTSACNKPVISGSNDGAAFCFTLFQHVLAPVVNLLIASDHLHRQQFQSRRLGICPCSPPSLYHPTHKSKKWGKATTTRRRSGWNTKQWLTTIGFALVGHCTHSYSGSSMIS